MAIKIIKKRQVEEQLRPAPVVDPPVAVEQPVERPRTPYREPTICRLCEHPYLEPCHGKSDTCMNAKWKRERMKKEN
jgi:hypothetical protein